MRNPVARALRVVARRDAARVPDLATLVSAAPVPLVALDADNRIRFLNPAAELFLGISIAQARQMALAELLAADHPLFLLLAQVRAQEMTIADHDVEIDTPRLRKEGLSVLCAPWPEETGGVVLVFQDASAARALDRHLSFRSSARSVAGMGSILAHEVKNPLSGIRGAAQLLESSVAPADRELAVLIRDEADRIRALMDRMEMFSARPPELRGLNIHRVLEHVRRLAQSGFAAHLRIVENYDPSLPPVRGNRDQLVQVLLNIVKNAAEAITEAGGEDGEIVLTTAYQHGMRLGASSAAPGGAGRTHLPLLVGVRDNGPGIPPDMRPNMFDPFVTSKRTGSGLGLALVAKIVADHGGMIEVDSRPGRTEFRLHLPIEPDIPETP